MKLIHTDQAPKAIGPYSQAVEINGWVFTSGVIAIHPQSGTIEEETIQGQTELVFANLKAILHESGCSLKDVVKTTVFLTDMNDFPIVNEIYQKHFSDHRPARSTVQVAKLPKNGKIEIEAIAFPNDRA